MANKTIFKTNMRGVPQADTVTSHGTPAYLHDVRHSLAQLAATGCFNDTFYTKAEDQLDTLIELATAVDTEFLAKTAVYARQSGYMKDMPAVLMAFLAARGKSEHGTKDQGKSAALFRKAFPQVINTGKMLRVFVQVLRSGTVGGRCFNLSANTIVKKCINDLLNSVSLPKLFNWSVGNDPSLGDVIRMTRPKANTPERAALFQHLLKNTRVEEGLTKTYFKGEVRYEHSLTSLPEIVQQYEAFKRDTSQAVPDVDFRLVEGLGLTAEQWKETARNASWTETRMNLNKYQRHGVFDDKEMVASIATRIANPKLIKEANAFPYQLMTAYRFATDIPYEVKESLQDAMEIAIANVPKFDTTVYVAVDHSWSMQGAVTGRRDGSTSKVRCVDVASLMGASILRNNKQATLLPFNTHVSDIEVNPRDTVLTNADKLAKMCGGGTCCSAPLRLLNEKNAKGNLVIFVSDNESWFDSLGPNKGDNPVQEEEWRKYKHRNPGAKIVCIDIVPERHCQVKQRQDVLNVGGFSDKVFDVIAGFMESDSADHWVDVIASTNF
jgi:60 kDa SS-A/Ro ribonucleoprotein